LSFLDDYVSEALEKGAAPYKPVHMRRVERHQEETEGGTLNRRKMIIFNS